MRHMVGARVVVDEVGHGQGEEKSGVADSQGARLQKKWASSDMI